jgi:hypothetical protein
MEGLLTHAATADCFMIPPHSALECGIVAAWWRLQVEAEPVCPASQPANVSREQRGD